MPKNYSAYLRYKIIDECLRNNYHPSQKTNEPGYWTLEEIAEKCWEEIGKRPSERTLKQDILRMRNGELGFEAPIENEYGIGYSYADTNFSIHKMPLYESEVEQMTKSLAILQHFKGMAYFTDLQKIIKKLKTIPQIADYYQYEPVRINKGYEFFDVIIESLEKSKSLMVEYKPFDEEIFELEFHPGFIKEYNQRWYIIGINGENKPYNLAFDRIRSAQIEDKVSLPFPTELRQWHKHIIGVTLSDDLKINKIRLKIDQSIMPYFITKPWHESQKVVEENKENCIVELQLMINIELISKILSFGKGISIERPAYLRKRIKESLEQTLENYR